MADVICEQPLKSNISEYVDECYYYDNYGDSDNHDNNDDHDDHDQARQDRGGVSCECYQNSALLMWEACLASF